MRYIYNKKKKKKKSFDIPKLLSCLDKATLYEFVLGHIIKSNIKID